MNVQLSKDIYDTFMQGSFINKSQIQGDRLQPNPLFDEIAKEHNREQYEQLYRAIGFDLIQLEECFFVNKLSESGETGEVAIRIQALIDMLHRVLGILSFKLQCLTDFGVGLELSKLESFDSNEDFQQILQAVGLKNSFSREIRNVLIGRGIAMLNHRERLVFTDAGKALSAHFLQLEGL